MFKWSDLVVYVTHLDIHLHFTVLLCFVSLVTYISIHDCYSCLMSFTIMSFTLCITEIEAYTKMCFGFQVLHQLILNQKTWPSLSQNKCMTITTMTILPYQRPGSGQISQNLNPTLRKKTAEKNTKLSIAEYFSIVRCISCVW